jgi:hypothetical protein
MEDTAPKTTLRMQQPGRGTLKKAKKKCPPDKEPKGDYQTLYDLPGPQVEPAAAYWLFGKALPRVPSIDEIKQKVGMPDPFFADNAELLKDFNQLKELEKRRGDLLPKGYLSDFIQLQSSPFGAVFNTSDPKGRPQFAVGNVNTQEKRIGLDKVVVLTGEELARVFEIETPGLYHRHALNWILYRRPDLSPPRQARIWMALDITIYAALSAAWFYKWGFDGELDPKKRKTSFRLRPYEYVRQPDFVLFERQVADDGDGPAMEHDAPCPSPGTPRHPAFPSGHSTYSAAASRILEYFITGPAKLDKPVTEKDNYTAYHLRKLANNIGEARLWAGVHWPRDHLFCQRVGKAVADCVIEQLQRDCIPSIVEKDGTPVKPLEVPPSAKQLRAFRKARKAKKCPEPDRHDQIPARENAERGFVVF